MAGNPIGPQQLADVLHSVLRSLPQSEIEHQIGRNTVSIASVRDIDGHYRLIYSMNGPETTKLLDKAMEARGIGYVDTEQFPWRDKFDALEERVDALRKSLIEKGVGDVRTKVEAFRAVGRQKLIAEIGGTNHAEQNVVNHFTVDEVHGLAASRVRCADCAYQTGHIPYSDLTKSARDDLAALREGTKSPLTSTELSALNRRVAGTLELAEAATDKAVVAAANQALARTGAQASGVLATYRTAIANGVDAALAAKILQEAMSRLNLALLIFQVTQIQGENEYRAEDKQEKSDHEQIQAALNDFLRQDRLTEDLINRPHPNLGGREPVFARYTIRLDNDGTGNLEHPGGLTARPVGDPVFELLRQAPGPVSVEPGQSKPGYGAHDYTMTVNFPVNHAAHNLEAGVVDIPVVDDFRAGGAEGSAGGRRGEDDPIVYQQGHRNPGGGGGGGVRTPNRPVANRGDDGPGRTRDQGRTVRPGTLPADWDNDDVADPDTDPNTDPDPEHVDPHDGGSGGTGQHGRGDGDHHGDNDRAEDRDGGRGAGQGNQGNQGDKGHDGHHGDARGADHDGSGGAHGGPENGNDTDHATGGAPGGADGSGTAGNGAGTGSGGNGGHAAGEGKAGSGGNGADGGKNGQADWDGDGTGGSSGYPTGNDNGASYSAGGGASSWDDPPAGQLPDSFGGAAGAQNGAADDTAGGTSGTGGNGGAGAPSATPDYDAGGGISNWDEASS